MILKKRVFRRKRFKLMIIKCYNKDCINWKANLCRLQTRVTIGSDARCCDEEHKQKEV